MMQSMKKSIAQQWLSQGISNDSNTVRQNMSKTMSMATATVRHVSVIVSK